MVLPLLWATIVPESAWAAKLAVSNETQINFKIKNDIGLVNGVAYTQYELIPIPRNLPGYEPVKDAEEIKREAILTRFKEKLERSTLPEGKFTINASAYTEAADECGKSDGITASGVRVKENRTLACPSWVPFGAKVNIEGYGTYTCEDRGGAIKGNHFDIYVKTKKQAFAFGRQKLLAEIIE
jgi:3D (Asp-Asp-Asp) domain-containing protein